MKFIHWCESRRARDMKICIIVRGLPGSGKSFKVWQLLKKYGGDEGHVFSTDNFFISGARDRRRKGKHVSSEEETAEYRANWSPDKLRKAHETNQQAFAYAVDNGVSPVIVDNTNVTTQNFRYYAEYAHKAGYEIKIEEPESDWWRVHRHMLKDKKKNAAALDEFAQFLADKNSHGVPLASIKNFINRWQDKVDLDESWERKIASSV